jgi:hypothetical protein
MSDPAGGVGWDEGVLDAIQGWVVVGSGLPSASVVWYAQDAPRPAAPAIVMRLNALGEFGPAWADTKPNPFVFSTLTVTGVDMSADTLAIANHGLLTGDGPVQLDAVTLPAPLATATDYWIIVTDAGHVQLATSYAKTGGGQGAGNPTTAIDLTSAGSGTITLSATTATVRAGAELLEVSRSMVHAVLELQCHATPTIGADMAVALLQRVRARRAWYSQMTALDVANVGMLRADRVRFVQGVRDALLFEPRALLEIHLSLPSEETGEPVTIIEAVQVRPAIVDALGNVDSETWDIPST